MIKWEFPITQSGFHAKNNYRGKGDTKNNDLSMKDNFWTPVWNFAKKHTVYRKQSTLKFLVRISFLHHFTTRILPNFITLLTFHILSIRIIPSPIKTSTDSILIFPSLNITPFVLCTFNTTIQCRTKLLSWLASNYTQIWLRLGRHMSFGLQSD